MFFFVDIDDGTQHTVRMSATGEDFIDCMNIFRESIRELEFRQNLAVTGYRFIPEDKRIK